MQRPSQVPLRSSFGTVSVVGVYGGFVEKIPMGSAIDRGLTFRIAQTPVQHYLPILMNRIEKGEIDPSFVITHTAKLEDAIVIGDTPYDAEAAGKAGLKTIGMMCGGFTEAALRDASCVAVYPGPAALLACFDASPLVK